MTRALVLGLGLLLAGCGGNGAIFLTIEGRGAQGDLRVPDDVDALDVVVTDEARGKTYLEKRFSLDPAVHRFPLTLGLEQGEGTDSPVRVTVTGTRAEAPVAVSSTLVPILREAVISVTVRLTLDEPHP